MDSPNERSDVESQKVTRHRNFKLFILIFIATIMSSFTNIAILIVVTLNAKTSLQDMLPLIAGPTIQVGGSGNTGNGIHSNNLQQPTINLQNATFPNATIHVNLNFNEKKPAFDMGLLQGIKLFKGRSATGMTIHSVFCIFTSFEP